MARATVDPVAIATFKDLCIDAVDATVLGSFWAATLGLDFHRQDSGDAFLRGPTEAHTIWINQVPEPKSQKHRTHLDVHGSATADLEDLGASVVDSGSFPWVVMADPEGGEFCLFIRDAPPVYRLYEVGIDAVDHDAISKWWASVLGGEQSADARGFSYVERIPNAPFDNLTFAAVEEPKRTKNRIHFDVVAEDIAELLEAGATLLRPRDEEINWDVLADPEGNEFCVFAAT
jgi:hypothetical protein